MATRLGLYNGALRHLGERRLSSLTESREPRRVLDGIWDDNFVRRVLLQGQWRFAKRTVKLDYSQSVTPEFGYRRAFAKPTDFVRLAELCSDEFMRVPLLHYRDAGAYWVAEIDAIYVGFVSDHTNYGSDLSKWPENFTAFAEAELATYACPRLENSQTDLDTLKKERRRLLSQAESTDAQLEPTKFPPRGAWAQARTDGRGISRSRYDRA
jgi:hypothetical protein